MRQATTFTLFALVALLINVVLGEPLFPNGKYVIYKGTPHNPPGHKYFTGSPNPSNWAVTLELKSTTPDKLQVWRLRNHSSGAISLELVGKPGYYLGEGRSGGLPGAYLGTNNANKQKWKITRVLGGDLTKYKLTFPRKFNNRTLVVDASPDSTTPTRVALAYEDLEITQAFRFGRV
ncbi:hypothetical protein BG015_009492 [Linnemannia schmuckeri]|uniref:Ricin B lectin domain-containing protein n=1 Tax=Linnemannia schmuckeri TaxID=64567 RepID=A0A9P5RVF3_9FUNG|nr:hypothetical protein BG015_009492 [Linnemannia schmuckeri]